MFLFLFVYILIGSYLDLLTSAKNDVTQRLRQVVDSLGLVETSLLHKTANLEKVLQAEIVTRQKQAADIEAAQRDVTGSYNEQLSGVRLQLQNVMM